MKVIHFISINKNFRIAGFLSAFLLVTLCGLTFLPVSFQDKHAEAATGTAAESTITLDMTNSVASVDLTVNSSNGTFATSTSNDEASFSVVTNNYTGYTLSISADDNTGELVNGEESLSSIESAISASTFDSSTYNGLWGYKPSKLNSVSNTNYLPSPTTEATTLDVTNTANNEANSYTIGLGARADYTKPSGTYSKTFILTAVANKINYSVTYNKNTTDTVTNMPYSNTGNVQSGDTGSTSIALSDLVPVRDGYNFKGWCSVATSDETCSGTTYNPDGAGTNLTYGIDQTTLNIGTLYAMWQSAETKCDDTKLCIQYEGNGLTYDGSKTVNRVNYNSGTKQGTITKYSHTPNISDDGTQNGNYAEGLETNEVITILGAQSVHIKLTYSTYYSGYDWVSFWAGNYPNNTANSNYSTGIQQCGNSTVTNGKFGNDTWSSSTVNKVTVECDVSGDTVTFGFHSESYTFGNYGYYAIITGTGTVFDRTVASGEYTTPTGTNAIFYGWSSTRTTTGAGHESDVEYTDESNVMSNMLGNEGESKTLYAVWQQGYSITFNKDSNVSNIAVLDSDGNAVGTITSSGQSLTLYQGDTYTIKPTYVTRYAPNTFEKSSGAGTFNWQSGYNSTFTVGAGDATINVTSQYVDTPMQNYSCSNIANVGNTKYVYDTRDNEVYLVGKLADNKCWLLDNLRLDLGNSTVLANTTASNTNASATSLNYMKNGGGTTSDQYPTAKINNVAWTSSSQNYYNIPMTVSSGNGWDKDTTVTSYGSGSGKIGVYYNYCAASAGSYCYNENAAPDGTNASQDICPAGWRMPTGGDSSGEYKALYTAYGSNDTDFINALSTPLSGYFANGGVVAKDIDGYFLSSTRYNGNYMCTLSTSSPSYVSIRSVGRRYYGDSVRCLLK